MTYRIGKLAKLAGVTADTIRFYEKNGLMSHGERTQGGYRLYNNEDLKRLYFIRYAKRLGFSLSSIAELLSIRVAPDEHTCQESKEIVEHRLQEVEKKLFELQHMQSSLQRLSALCCGSSHSSRECTILEVLENRAFPS